MGCHIRITRKKELSKDTFLGYDRKSMGAETVVSSIGYYF